jgi:release factor glutamine methyltransferase
MPHPQAHATDTWTTRRLLGWMTEHFQAKQIDSPRVVTEMLISHVLGCERMRLYMEVDRPSSPAELKMLRDLVARAAKHEPVQYLVGHAWFFGKQFEVNRSTLIPRPCTETIVEHVIQWLRLSPGHANPVIADIGTGTGCIAISLALQLKDARIIATDVVPGALELAKRNAEKLGVADRIDFRQGSLLEPLKVLSTEYGVLNNVSHSKLSTQNSVLSTALPGVRFNAICSNPPYISDAEWADVPANVKEYEPASALRGGKDGLDFIRPLIAEASGLLTDGGRLLIEIADSQRDAALELARANPLLTNSDVLKDHEGLWRVLAAERAV